jgi:hypothetical protein
VDSEGTVTSQDMAWPQAAHPKQCRTTSKLGLGLPLSTARSAWQAAYRSSSLRNETVTSSVRAIIAPGSAVMDGIWPERVRPLADPVLAAELTVAAQ